MNPAFIKEQLEEMNTKINSLAAQVALFQSANNIPLSLDQSLTGRGFLKIPGIVPLSGTNTYYVSTTSGGMTTKAITISNGLQTA
jgi:hypothetical protein